MRELIKKRNSFIRYSFAVLLTFIAFVLTQWASPYIKRDAFDFFQGAVFLTALYGGIGPSLLTSFLSIVVLDYFFLPPINAWACGVADIPRLAIFGAVAVLTSSFSARLKRSQDEMSKAIIETSQREQRRLGQDLHDGLCQFLVGIKLMTENIKEKILRNEPVESKAVAEIEDRLSEALAQADAISRGLCPVELNAEGFLKDLNVLLEKLSYLYGVACRLSCRRPPLFDDSIKATHVYRIAQEAVINAIKGGKAKHIDVHLAARSSVAVLTVTDDGIGFDGHPRRNGMGLRIMSYRAQIINGTLRFRQRLGGGTLMTCLWRTQ